MELLSSSMTLCLKVRAESALVVSPSQRISDSLLTMTTHVAQEESPVGNVLEVCYVAIAIQPLGC